MSHRPLLPPRGVFVGTKILFVPDISPPMRDTLLQLMALAWGSDSHQTPPLTLPLLEHLTGKKARTLRGHLASLRSYRDVLRLQPAGEGQFIILFSAWLFGKVSGETTPVAPAANIPPKPVNDHKDDDEFNPHLLHSPGISDSAVNDDHVNHHDRAPRSRPAACLSQELSQALVDADIYTGLIPEIARIARDQEWTEEDLEALLAWCLEDFPDRPGGMFMARLRREFRPPLRYYSPACPSCGMHGKHGPECPKRYLMYDDEEE